MFRRRRRSALFVDFDNVVGALTGEFGRTVAHWLDWIEDGAFDKEAERPRGRRLVAKRVYWNYQNAGYSGAFEAAGFETFICASRVLRGRKSSADMSIAIDALELAFEKPEIEEFIVLTADTDFVPLIDKLTDRGCRTAALAKDNASFVAYSEHADIAIDAADLRAAFAYAREPGFFARLRGRGAAADGDRAPPPGPPHSPAEGGAAATPALARAIAELRAVGLERQRQRKPSDLGRRAVISVLRARVRSFRTSGGGAYFGLGSYENMVQRIAETEPDFDLREEETGGVTLIFKRPEERGGDA